MRIAQVAPLWEQIPPPAYGGTELIVSLLTDELVRRGHEVTLFATQDSTTLARLIPGCETGLRLQDVLLAEYAVYEQMQLSNVFSMADEFDLIHCHMDYAALPYAKFCQTSVVHTIHGIFTPLVEQIFTQHRSQNLISISESQRRQDLPLNYIATVYNAIALDTYDYYATPDEPPYLAFLGRMSVEKGPHLAIEIAKCTGLPLKMGGKIDFDNKQFFEQEVAPHIDDQHITFLGEVDHATKNELMGRAIATLFPITWQEPFGLVMPESMACGTPVIAMRMGAAPEVIVDGKTGFLCDNVDECVAAVAKVTNLNRQDCRRHVEAQFSPHHMVDGYEAVYRQVVAEQSDRDGYRQPVVLVDAQERVA